MDEQQLPPTTADADDTHSGQEAQSAPSADHHASSPLERTGVPSVDEVLDRVEGADDLPVDDHVAVFERAHEDLRRALDSAGRD